jgi:hypothetical protein
MMRVRSGLLVVLAVACFLANASPAYPQGSTAVAQLNGTVLDESGATVKGATLTLRQTDTNRSDHLERFWILRPREPSPGALRTDDRV